MYLLIPKTGPFKGPVFYVCKAAAAGGVYPKFLAFGRGLLPLGIERVVFWQKPVFL